MSDEFMPEPFHAPHLLAPAQALWKLINGLDVYACDLLDSGEWGVEAQISRNRAFLYSRRLDTLASAVEWAHRELEQLARRTVTRRGRSGRRDVPRAETRMGRLEEA